jgi:dolichyl-phosphate beta-glucosyltransferase
LFRRVGGAPEPIGKLGAGATLSLVIPAYNEEARLPDLLEALATSAAGAVTAAGLELCESVVVDDGSEDRTAKMLAEAAAHDPMLRPVLGASENAGKGAAIAAGVREAKGDYVLLADVDLSTPLEELSKLTAAIGAGADVAVGSRGIDGAVVDRGPRHRKLMGKVFNGAVRLMTGLELRDTQCGFKLLPTGVAKRLLAEQTCSGFSFDVELLMRADRANLRIAEVPVLYLHDPRSRVRVVSASYRMLRDVAGLAYRLRRRERPYAGAPLLEARADNRD